MVWTLELGVAESASRLASAAPEYGPGRYCCGRYCWGRYCCGRYCWGRYCCGRYCWGKYCWGKYCWGKYCCGRKLKAASLALSSAALVGLVSALYSACTSECRLSTAPARPEY